MTHTTSKIQNKSFAGGWNPCIRTLVRIPGGWRGDVSPRRSPLRVVSLPINLKANSPKKKVRQIKKVLDKRHVLWYNNIKDVRYILHKPKEACDDIGTPVPIEREKVFLHFQPVNRCRGHNVKKPLITKKEKRKTWETITSNKTALEKY